MLLIQIQTAAEPKLEAGPSLFLKQHNQCLCNYLTPLVQDSKLIQIKPST